MRRDSCRARDIEGRACFRYIPNDAVDRAPVELDDARLEHALARGRSLVVKNLDRWLGLALGLPSLGKLFGVLGGGRNIVFCQGRSDPGSRELEPHLAVLEIDRGSPVAWRWTLAVDVAAPPPMSTMRLLRDSADRKSPPDHLIVIGLDLAIDNHRT